MKSALAAVLGVAFAVHLKGDYIPKCRTAAASWAQMLLKLVLKCLRRKFWVIEVMDWNIKLSGDPMHHTTVDRQREGLCVNNEVFHHQCLLITIIGCLTNTDPNSMSTQNIDGSLRGNTAVVCHLLGAFGASTFRLRRPQEQNIRSR